MATTAPPWHQSTLWLRVLRPLAGMVLLCAAISGFLGVLTGNLGNNAVYSFAIGFSCWGSMTLLRRLGQGVFAAWRRWHGLPPADAGWWAVTPALAASMLLGPALGLAIGDALLGLRTPSVFHWGASGTQITLAITVLATAVMVAVTRSTERATRAQLRAQAAQREAAEAQLRLLQSQLEPHMLFNTLANLRVLIGLDPARAQAMLDHLIAYLRATLAASRQDTHALSAEFDRLADFLALMAVRMGPRLQVALDLPQALRQVRVPPLLLQPLVENAIKHGLEPQVAGGRIEVQARADGALLRLTVRDTGVGLRADPATAGTRFGLTQVRQRLATLFGDQAGVSLANAADAEGGVTVALHLPLLPPDSDGAAAPPPP